MSTKSRRAIQVAQKIKEGPKKRTKKKIRKRIRFHRPITLQLEKSPKYPKRSHGRLPKLDQYSILKYPLNTERTMKVIEDCNTLVFIVDLRANKYQIADAVQRMYDVKPISVNTLIRPDGLKKAFVKLSKADDAMNIADKIGF